MTVVRSLVLDGMVVLTSSCGLLPPAISCDGSEADCEEVMALAQTLLPRDIDRAQLIRATIDFIGTEDQPDAAARIELVYPGPSGEQPMVMFVERPAPGEPFRPSGPSVDDGP